MAWRCIICAVFFALNLNVLLTHYNSVHRNDEKFHTRCIIDNCMKEFTKANTFSKHVRTSHRGHLYNTAPVGMGEGHVLIGKLYVLFNLLYISLSLTGAPKGYGPETETSSPYHYCDVIIVC